MLRRILRREYSPILICIGIGLSKDFPEFIYKILYSFMAAYIKPVTITIGVANSLRFVLEFQHHNMKLEIKDAKVNIHNE